MTVSTTTSRVRYEGDGATRVFPIPFKFVDNAHVKVTLRDAASRETPWREGSEYRLSGAGNDSGGSLTVLTEPLDHRPRAGEVLVVALELPFTQDKAFPLGGAFPTTQVEEGLDLAALRDAQLAAFDARAFSVPATDAQVGGLELPIDSLRAGRYLGFDGAGKPALLAGTAEAADLSDKTVLPTGASAARTIADLLGLGALTAANVKLYGAKGDTAELADGTVTDGSAVLSSGSVAFTEADVGKAVWVEAAATAGKAISTIANGPIDAAWQYDSVNDSFADFTAALNSDTAGDVEPFPAVEAVGDVFYIGHAEPFTGVEIDIGTAGVGGTVVWEYWDGSAWQALSVTDGTAGFTAAPGNHDLTFTPPGDWAATQINAAVQGEKLYYIRARLTAVYTTNPILDDATLQGGRVRITANAHGFNPGQVVTVKGIVGTTEANGTFETVRAGLNAFDLKGSSFANTYVSGGTAHGWLFSTIQSVSDGDATLAANAGASIAGTARFLYGTDDTAAIQAAIDSGKTVVVPDGAYLTGPLKVVTEGQKIIGTGGRLLVNPTADVGTLGSLLRLVADFTAAIGLYLDNPTEQKTDDGPDAAINRGISIEANKVRVEGNIVRRFLGGIAVTDRPGDTFEFGGEIELHGNVITGNIVWENLGAGSGDDQGGSLGEDRGDGIVSWGAATVITSNVVHVKEGYDARIGIHVEALGLSHDKSYPYSDHGATILGNIVLGNGIESRNGRWRRGIVDEGVRNSTIASNFVSGAVWWGIAAIFSGERGDVSINGNTILFDRPAVDISGENFFPVNAGIMLFAAGDGGGKGFAVTGNTIRVTGTTSRGITSSNNGGGRQMAGVTISGNTIRSDGGNLGNYINLFEVKDVVIDGNFMEGGTTQVGVRTATAPNQTFVNNQVKMEGNSKFAVELRDGGGDFAIVKGNYVTGGSVGLNVFFFDRVVVEGNVVTETASHGIDMFASDEGVVANNVLKRASGAGAATINNWGAGPTKLLANNLFL